MEGKTATKEVLLEELRNLYWSATEGEVRNMILAFEEALRPSVTTPKRRIDIADLDTRSFRNTFKNWTQTADEDWANCHLYQEVLQHAEKHLSRDDELTLALKLLKSSAFLDLDVLLEPARQALPSYQLDDPFIEVVEIEQQESTEKIWIGMQCRGCSCLIRSKFFYICTSGCVYQIEAPLHVWKNGQTQTLNEVPSSWRRNCKLCATCVKQNLDIAPCGMGHLKKTLNKEPNERALRQFRTDLSRREDRRYRKAHPEAAGLVNNAMAKLDKASNIRTFAREYGLAALAFHPLHYTFDALQEVHTVFAPAGSFHVSLMFGPLIFETGLENIKHGILVSNRPLPQLCFNQKGAEMSIDLDSTSLPATNRDWPCLNLFKRLGSSTRFLSIIRHELKHRNILGTSKRVYGGAFSAYPSEDEQKVQDVLECFVQHARKYRSVPRSKTVVARQRFLSKCSAEVTGAIRKYLEGPIDTYLNRFSSLLLDEQTSISYNMFTNNCQNFVDQMLKGKDFEYMFPRLPYSTPSPQWPRYLISFGDGLDGVHRSGRQTHSLLSRFANYRREQCDLIDIIELILCESRDDNAEDGKHLNENLWSLSRWQELLLLVPQQDMPSMRLDQTFPNIREVLWDLPRDTFSILQSHMLRPMHLYRTQEGKPLGKAQWLENRARLLSQLDIVTSLMASLGVAVLAAFRRYPTLIERVTIPKSRVFGGLRADENVRIVRPTKWTATYLISNRRSAPLWHDISDDAFSRISKDIGKKIRNLPGMSSKSIKFVSDFAGNLIRKELKLVGWTGALTPTINVIPISSMMVMNLIKRRLHGQDDWTVITIGDSMTILQQNLRRHKNTRNSET